MGIQIPVGYANCAMNVECTGRTRGYAVTFGVQNTSPASTPNGLAQLVDAAMTSGLAPWSSPGNCLAEYHYSGITLTLMTGTGPMPGQFPNSRQGTAATGAPPGNVALIVRKLTTRGGRAGRGRMFSPPFNIGEASIDAAGFMGPATVTALTQEWEAFRQNLITAGCPLVLLHGPNKAGTPIPAPDAIQNLVVENEIGTQRRRIRR